MGFSAGAFSGLLARLPPLLVTCSSRTVKLGMLMLLMVCSHLRMLRLSSRCRLDVFRLLIVGSGTSRKATLFRIEERTIWRAVIYFLMGPPLPLLRRRGILCGGPRCPDVLGPFYGDHFITFCQKLSTCGSGIC